MQRTIVILLLVVAGLTGAQLARDFLSTRTEAHGQTVGIPTNGFVLATGLDASGNVPVVYVLNPREETMGAYVTRKDGIEFLGSRRVTWDLQWDELSFRPKAGREEKSVKKVKAMLAKRDKKSRGTSGNKGQGSGSPKKGGKGSTEKRKTVIVKGPESLLGGR